MREASRRLVRAPWFAATAIGSVGVGIGLAGSVFAVVQSAFFTPLPFAEPDRLVELWGTESPGVTTVSDWLQPRRVLEWTVADTRYLEAIAGSSLASLTMRSAEGPVRVEAAPIVGDWFGVLGARAERGRVLTPADLRAGAEPAAVVSAGFEQAWTPDGPGATLDLSGTIFTVVGVMPAAFEAASRVWVATESLPEGADPVAYRGVARLRDGATLEEAVEEVHRMAATEVSEDSLGYGGFGATARPMGATRGSGDDPLWVVAGVVAAVLLIGLSNLTQLFLVRAQGQSRALAVRASLGGSAWQIGRGLAAEAGLVGLLGAALGLALSTVGQDVVGYFVGDAYPLASTRTIGLPGVALATSLGVLVALVVGLEPMRRVGSLRLQSLLQRRSGGSETTPGERRTRNALVAVQVATCLVLVSVTGVVVAGYRGWAALDVGYDAESVVEAIPDYEIAGIDDAEAWALARTLADRLRRRPEVGGVGIWNLVGMDYPPRPEYEAVTDGPEVEIATFDGLYSSYQVEPGFFDALGIEILAGRPLSAADGPGGEQVAVITERGADLYWPGEDPIGRQVKLGERGRWLTIVGVSEDVQGLHELVRAVASRDRMMPVLFRPAVQSEPAPFGWGGVPCCSGVTLSVRAASSTDAAAVALREELTGLAPDLPITRLGTMRDLQMDSYYPRGMALTGRLVGLGAAVAVMLSVVGIVGVVAEGLSRRTREIGTRVALGARVHQITGVVARESVLTAFAGIALGLLILVPLDRVVSAIPIFRFAILRVAPHVLDPWLLGGMSAAVVGLMVATSVLMARRATTVDPMVALRSE